MRPICTSGVLQTDFRTQRLTLTLGTDVACAPKETNLLNGCPTNCAGLFHTPSIHQTTISAGLVKQISLRVPAMLAHCLSQCFLDRLVKRVSFIKAEIHCPSPGMDFGAEKDILKVSIPHAPDTGLTDEEVLDAPRITHIKCRKRPLQVLEGKSIA